MFRFYENLILNLRNSFDQIDVFLVFFTRLLICGKMSLPVLTHKLKESQVEIDREKYEEN